MSKLLTETEAADFLAMSPATLRRWRVEGTGPVFTKIGRAVRYPEASLVAYVERNTRSSTTEQGARI